MSETYVVHLGTGTVLDATDGVVVVRIPGGWPESLTDEDVVLFAERHGRPLGGV